MNIFAFIFSVLWILAGIGYGLICPEQFAALKPNEYGDFFAGLFAPLAFLWLVVGHFQHGKEIKNQAEEIAKQQQAILQLLEIEKEKIGAIHDLGSDIGHTVLYAPK